MRSAGGALLGAFVLAGAAWAEPRGVKLDDELAEAKAIVRVKVGGYAPGRIDFKALEPKNGPGSARVDAYDDKWMPRLDGKFRAQSVWTGSWPSPGDELIVVIDAGGVVSLFAQPIGDELRFWSPVMTGSVAMFDCGGAAPVSPMATASGAWDGCLMPARAVKLRVGGGRPPPPAPLPPPPPRPCVKPDPSQPRYLEYAVFAALAALSPLGADALTGGFTRAGMASWASGESRQPARTVFAQGDFDGDGIPEAAVSPFRGKKGYLVVASRKQDGWRLRAALEVEPGSPVLIHDDCVWAGGKRLTYQRGEWLLEE